MKLLKCARKGFTMLELLVVVALIGVLASLTTLAVSKLTRGAKEANASAVCAQLKAAMEAYKSDNNEYPFPSSSGDDETLSVGTVSSNRAATSNVYTIMRLCGRNESGKRDTSLGKAYFEDLSGLYVYQGGRKVYKLLDVLDSGSISSGDMIGFKVRMGKSKAFDDLSERDAFAPIKISIDFTRGGYLSVSSPTENDFASVIELR